MYRSKCALFVGAVVGLMLPRLSLAAELSPGVSAAPASVLLAQYDGPGFDGPYGGPGGPYGGPGGPYGGPGGGYDGGGPYGDGPYGHRRHHAGPSGQGPTQRVSYHGFRIDLSAGGASPNLASQVASVEHQIDIVDSVGLSVANLELFRSLPIRVTNGLGGGGHYSGGPYVTIGNLLTTDNRPVLLHEFMHVLNHRHMSGGFHNADIHHFYEEAQANGLFQSGSYMMTNAAEYFAVTASCYLYGTVAREPYNRETIRRQQPDYYAFLERMFGPAHGSHDAADAWPHSPRPASVPPHLLAGHA